jgi:hypothetical protein
MRVFRVKLERRPGGSAADRGMRGLPPSTKATDDWASVRVPFRRSRRPSPCA